MAEQPFALQIELFSHLKLCCATATFKLAFLMNKIFKSSPFRGLGG
jgi:hypothetical protein